MTETSRTTTEEPRLIEPQDEFIMSKGLYAKLLASNAAIEHLIAQSDERLALWETASEANAHLSDKVAELTAYNDIMISTAASATLRGDRATNRADRAEADLCNSRDAYRNCREALKTALEIANAPNCQSCSGTGNGVRYGNGGPECETPPELVDIDGCEDCDGLGLEWL